MSDYLNSLVTRTLRLAPVVQPRLASLFEPVASATPINEPAFAVSETTATQENASTNPRRDHELFETPVRETERTFTNTSSQTVPLAQTFPANLLPGRVTPASTFLKGDWESAREVRDQESSPHSTETESITSAAENRNQSTSSLIKPEVRIVSQTANREPIQPSFATPPLAPVLPYNAGANSALRSRDFNAQPTEPATAPETVVVTIGRVDVRAIFAPPPAAPRATRTQPQPLSLDEYLKQRSEGRR